jgi:hypothetical protein
MTKWIQRKFQQTLKWNEVDYKKEIWNEVDYKKEIDEITHQNTKLESWACKKDKRCKPNVYVIYSTK